MSAMKELYLQTESLLDYISQPLPKDDDEKDLFIATLEERLSARDEFITQVNRDSLSDNEVKLGHELMKLNEKLNTRLAQIRTEIRANITMLSIRKKNARKYENPYDGPSADGIFIDKRGI